MIKIREYIKKRLEETENDGEVVVKEVKENFNNQCEYVHCGGFESPGYDIDCYAIAFIDENGILGIVNYSIEMY